MKNISGVAAGIIAIVSSVMFLGLSAPVFAAGTATLYVAPAAGSPKSGSTLSVTVYENSGADSINAVQANLRYSTSQLHYVNFRNSAAFSVEGPDPTGDTGTLDFVRGVINGSHNQVSGAQAVVTINFAVKAAGGTAKISFASGSAVVRSTDNVEEALTTIGGSYNVAAATTLKTTSKTPAPTATVSEPSPVMYATMPTPGQTITVKSGSGALTIGNLNVNSDSSSLNTVITWQTNKPATSIVSYGADKDHLLTMSDGQLVTSHAVTLDPNILQAGGNYFYYVSSTDSSGDKVSSQLLPFVAAGGSGNSTAGTEASFASKVAIGVAAGVAFVVLAAVVVRMAGKSLARHREMARHFPDLPAKMDQQVANAIRPQAQHVTAQSPHAPQGPTVVKPNGPPDSVHGSTEIKKY